MDERDKPKYDAFISYSWKDEQKGAASLDIALQAKRFRTWRDKRDIDPTQDFRVEIERAIESAACVIVCITSNVVKPDSYVQREIAYALALRRPIFVARFEEVTPPESIRSLTWLEFFSDWTSTFERLCGWLRKKIEPDQWGTELSDSDPFRPYLAALYQQVVSDLSVTVFSSEVIQLRSQSVSGAVFGPSFPRRFVNYTLNEPQSATGQASKFTSMRDAYEHYRGRLLVLGIPGSGKTTSILAFARDAIAERFLDRRAPLPVLARVSTWDPVNQTPVLHWIAREMEYFGGANIKPDHLKRLLLENGLLLLLDGLDELGREVRITDTGREDLVYDPRERFLSLLPTSGYVVLTSRESEYHEVDSKANLGGAISLSPLEDDQIRSYLSDVDELWDALSADGELRDAIRTPLLLALFRIGFSGLPIETKQLRDLRGRELNDFIWKVFIRRRWEFEQARSAEPLPFSVDELRTRLGRIAAKSLSWTKGSNKEQIWISLRDSSNDKNTSILGLSERLNLMIPQSELNEEGLPEALDDNRRVGKWRFLHLRLRDHLAFEPLIQSLAIDETSVQEEALRALGNLGDDRAADAVLDRLRGGSGNIPSLAVKTLRALRAADHLLNALRYADGDLRQGIFSALGELKDERAVAPLIELLTRSEKDDQISIMWALGSIGDERAIEPIADFLDDPRLVDVWDDTYRVGHEAADALRLIGTDEAMTLLRRHGYL